MQRRSGMRRQKRFRNNMMLLGSAALLVIIISFIIIKPELVFLQVSQENEEQEPDSEEEEVQEPEEEEEEAITEYTKKIALTFDDGPSPDTTPQILSLLDKYNAKATFFLLGERVEKHPEIVQWIYEAGHEIGNHTYNHLDLTTLTAEQIMNQYEQTDDAIMEAIGQPSTVFRPPYGAKNPSVEDLIPIPMVNWTLDTNDWKHKNEEQTLQQIKDNIHDDAIVLMHDIHASTANGLEAILEYLTDEGYHFVTVSEMMSFW